MRALWIPLLLVLAFSFGCSSKPERREITQGRTVNQPADVCWAATTTAMRAMGRGQKQIDNGSMTASAQIGGQLVRVAVEEGGTRGTILRVWTTDAVIAEEVLGAITALIPR